MQKHYKSIYTKRILNFILVLFTSVYLVSCQTNSVSSISIRTPIGISFPAITTKEQQALSVKHLKALNISKIKMDVNWKYIEKEVGVYSFDTLDYRINTFIENDIEVFIGISSVLPDIYLTDQSHEITLEYKDAFLSFITKLITRYQNKITKVQFGNEWDHPDLGYKNNIDNFIGLNNIVYNVTKEINPSIDVVLGGLTSNYFYYQLLETNNLVINKHNRKLKNFDHHLSSFIKRMDLAMDDGLKDKINYVLRNSLYDIADLHMYDEVELFDDMVIMLRSMIDKPILISEYGAPNPDYENYTQKYQLKRTNLILEGIGNIDLVEIYHFSLFDHDAYHGQNGLLDSKGNKKLVYELYEKLIVT